MDRIAFISATFFSLLLAINGSLSTPSVFARKGYNPKLGALVGAIFGFAGTILAAVLLLTILPDRGLIGAAGGLAGGLAALILLWNMLPNRSLSRTPLPEGNALRRNIQARHIRGRISRALFVVAIVVALVALATLIWTILNRTVGLTAVQNAVQPEDLQLNGETTGRPLGELSDQELNAVLAQNTRATRLRVFILSDVANASEADYPSLSTQPVAQVLKGKRYPPELAETPLNKLDGAQAAAILALNLGRHAVEDLIFTEVIKPEVVKGWSLWQSLTRRDEIKALVAEKFPKADLKWRSWVSWKFISSPLDPRKPDATGLRPALIGSIMIILITIAVAFPVGVGAAIYLEEYAGDNVLNRIIQTNINNLAGVPSIIYGIVGLAVFVRAMVHLTSGNVFGTDTANGRTIIAAGFTLALLILPLIIINAQEAIRAVPSSLRQASYGLGATQWQTIWNHVLPYAMPGILTGTILAISRAIGETAPLVLVGAATYITQDPKGPFSNFTALPMLIYRWTGLPQAEFRNAAAAAIVVLLVLLLTLNSTAVILRNRFTRRVS